ncbi:hypothetical protein BD833_1332 [Blastococcus xanthinilyticus]|uniref:Uncharacterized protein n=1 Tax=Blastococcus xanthinilyticus TaxID=1564164 RepID=A0A5S5CJT3_9ACTN|nr:hypothetical protein BD833_1332 [Blastococcus xanthinilyticus]
MVSDVLDNVYDPRNHSLVAVWNQQPLAPRHAMHPSNSRTVCGIDTRSGSWETWQTGWHGFVDGGGTACRRCVRMTRP